ncbi:adenosylcobinamide-GDP ribazoletransferase [Gordonia oryzae]|uniref:Adenosylcobinamide-GDP ribazoletransferase n=1 Tax=Gordonia oryzae TaxID=2487349 RepID=A0A3N4HC78_9ACTN|nr:adenosylcobinamide-GDP ribazoletransferase [Gordonia oryzae]RPA63414.1 adenosylcobinamide-GDP ribazoletransferase [Gordonia oryzae]
MSPVRAIAVSLSWLTVLPVPRRFTASAPDRRLGGAVIAAVPVIGILHAAVVTLIAWGLSHTAAPAMLIGVLIVGVLAGSTRGMHLDGLADTADGLGCYGPPQRVTEVMRSGSVGPFGVATLVLVLALQVVGSATLVAQSRWWELGLAIGVARVAAVVACRRALQPAHRDGFGALVAGTQRIAAVVWSVVAVAVGVVIGCLANMVTAFSITAGLPTAATIVVMLAFTWLFSRHCARRMGGIVGDVLGAVIELATALVLVGLIL